VPKPSFSNAVSCINRGGVLLVFSIENRELPPSLWTEFFPNTKMRWEWDESGDRRVSDMWALMKRLSDCRQVVYSKWYRGRATFFSRELFTSMICLSCTRSDPRDALSETARRILEILENNSPLSTRELKRATDLQGKLNETAYNRAMKELFNRLLIVGFGEVDDGAFPSLSVGATELLFDDLWREAQEMPARDAKSTIDRFLPQFSHFRRYFDKSAGLQVPGLKVPGGLRGLSPS
jgi:hypothetical protein